VHLPLAYRLVNTHSVLKSSPFVYVILSACTTLGVNEKQVYLLHVLRKRLNYPELKRTVIEQAQMFDANTS
jgi:hypothetical protein